MKSWHTDRLLLIAGGGWLVLGTAALISPVTTYLVIIKYMGIALLLDGLLLLTISISDKYSKINAWRFSEVVVDMSFSILLLLDPVFAQLIFPILVTPWMAAKGLLEILGSLVLARNNQRWRGDFAGGVLLLGSSIFIPHEPVNSSYNICLLIGVLGWILGLIYCYDYYRETHPAPPIIKKTL